MGNQISDGHTWSVPKCSVWTAVFKLQRHLCEKHCAMAWQRNHDTVRVIFMVDVCEDHDDGVIIYSGGRAAAGQQTVKADARAAKREIQRRTMTSSKSDTEAKSSLTKPKLAVNRPKRVELVNFRGVLVPKEVETRCILIAKLHTLTSYREVFFRVYHPPW